MSSAEALFGEIFQITRGDLEDACFPFIDPAEYIRGMAAIHLVRMSEFWKSENNYDPGGLIRRTEDFVGGLYGQGCKFLFLLCGTPREIQCWLAVESGSVDQDSLESLARSNFSDVRFTQEHLDTRSFESLRYALMVTGTPSRSQPSEEQRLREQLDSLLMESKCCSTTVEPTLIQETLIFRQISGWKTSQKMNLLRILYSVG